MKHVKSIHVHFLIILIYAVLAVIFFHQAFLDGRLIAPGDGIIQNYPTRVFLGDALRSGIFPLWVPYEYLGLPFLGNTQGGVLYPFNWLFVLPSSVDVYNLVLLFHYVLGAYFCFLYFKSIGLGPVPAFAGGMIFAFGGFLQAHKGHNQMVNVAIWLPALFYIIERLRAGANSFWVILGGGIIALQILAGHIHTFVLCAFISMFYAIFTMSRVGRSQRSSFIIKVVMLGLIGIALASSQLIAGKELAALSSRVAIDFQAFSYGSYSLFHLPHMLFPYFFGSGYGVQCYWGKYSLTETGGFVGIFVLVMALLTVIKWRWSNDRIVFFGALGIISFVLALGDNTPLYRLMYHVPVYNLFRIPARNLLGVDFALAVLFAMGLDVLARSRIGSTRHGALLVGSTTCLLLIMFVLVMFSASHPEIYSTATKIRLCSAEEVCHSLSLANPAIFIPIIFAVLYCIWSLTWWVTASRKSLVFILCIVLFGEMYSFGAYHDTNWPRRELKHYQALNMDFPPTGRMISIPGERSGHLFSLVHKQFSLNGYDPLQIRDFYTLTGIGRNGSSNRWHHMLLDNTLLSLFSVKYIAIHHTMNSFLPVLDRLLHMVEPGKQTGVSTPALTDWEFLGSARKDKNVLVCGGSGGHLSMCKQVVSLEPWTVYRLYGEIRKQASADRALKIDIFGGAGYDRADQQVTLLGEDVSSEYQRIHYLFVTQDIAQSHLYLRVFTSSSTPFLIRNLRLDKLQSLMGESSVKHSTGSGSSSALYRRITQKKKWTIYENTRALDRAYFVTHLLPASGLEEINHFFHEHMFAISHEALVSEDTLSELAGGQFGQGRVLSSSYGINTISLTVDVKKSPGFLVLTDQFYPGWKAYIDGTETMIYKVNGLVRGVRVPQGKHDVIFTFKPSAVIWSLAGSGLLLSLLCGLGLFLFIKNIARTGRQ